MADAELTKPDLIIVARARCLEYTTAQLKAKPLSELLEIIGDISMDEYNEVLANQGKRKKYANLKLPALKTLARQYGVGITGNKEQLIDNILDVCDTVQPMDYELDDSQQAILDQYEDARILINAGPGSGKTTTLSALVTKVVKTKPGNRVLVLVYNRNARTSFKQKLKVYQTTVTPKAKLLSQAGLFVVTFDEYIYHTRLGPNGYYKLDNYRNNFELGLAFNPHSAEHFDYLVVDEAQDLLPNHVQLIEQLEPLSRHVVIAGDPRQEIYIGASYFSHQWITASPEVKHTLKYNHRASPELVELVNAYSRIHFPSLHYDQVASRPAGGKINFSVVEARDTGSYVAELFVNGSNNAYCLSPVTVDKFKTNLIITSLRQYVYELKPGSTLHAGLQSGSTAPGWAIGNSYAYKGTERSQVYVIQSDLPYTDYGLPDISVKKLVYVAISRARDDLAVILSHRPEQDEIWAQLVPPELKLNTTRLRPALKPQQYLAVVEDLAKLECWTLMQPDAGNVIAQFDPVKVKVEQDADFVGIWVETHLANALGVPANFSYVFKPAKTARGKLCEPVGIYVDTVKQVYEVTFDPRHLHRDQQTFIDSLTRLEASTINHSEYTRAVIKMSAGIGKIWTVSERLATEHIDVSSLVKTITKTLGLTIIPRHGQAMVSSIYCHRSSLQVGAITAETDLIWLDPEDPEDMTILELKHTTKTESYHLNQARIYQALTNARQAYLANTQTGEILEFKGLSLNQVHNTARAILAFKFAMVVAQRLPRRIPTVAKTSVYISVDLEYQGEVIYEVGAVAYQPNTDRVIGVYHRIWTGAKPDVNAFDLGVELDSDDDDEAKPRGMAPSAFQSLTGLILNSAPTRAQLSEQATIKQHFRQWVQTMTNTPTYVIWGSTDNDLTLLGIKTEHKINAMQLFRAWLDNTKQGRSSNYSLSDAVSQCLGVVPFVAHRAYEDAVMTASVLTAITDIDGQC